MSPSKTLFLLLLMMGTMMTMTAPTWFVAWLGLEINLLSFMPLIKNSPNSSESSLKYFLTQAIASIFIILSLSSSTVKLDNLIMASLMLKLGAAPLHFWLPSTIKSLSPLNSATLLSWQKMAPMSLIPSVKSPIMLIPMIMSAILSAWSGLNELRLKLLLTYASINHLAWLLMINMYSMMTMYYYLTIYTFLTFTIFMLSGPLHHVSQIWSSTRSHLTLMFPFLILSMAGLPPLTGFMPKWIALNLTVMYETKLLVLLMLSSLFLMYFYLRLSWSSISLSKPSKIYSPHINLKPWTLMMLLNLTLPLLSFCV